MEAQRPLSEIAKEENQDEEEAWEEEPSHDGEYDFFGKAVYSINEGESEPEILGKAKPQKPARIPERRTVKYSPPPLSLLKTTQSARKEDYSGALMQKEIIDKTLRDFRIGGRVVHFTKGPTVTQFEIKLDDGVKVERVKNIARNLQMNLEGRSIRIEAPIPGKSTIGIEVPNIEQEKVLWGFDFPPRILKDGNPLNAALGVDRRGISSPWTSRRCTTLNRGDDGERKKRLHPFAHQQHPV